MDLWRELNDRGGEIDALASLGRALVLLVRPEDARRTLESALALSRAAGDVRAEELVLERLSLALLNRRDFGGAAAALDQALEAARASGDFRREARVLWIRAIAWAEMDRPDQALAKAEESVGLLRALGGPEASWFETQVRRYRSAAVVRSDAASLLGGSIDASAAAMGRAPTAPGAPDGPGVLRMALSATRAMATFLGTGMRTTSADARQNRLAICRTCEHHAGLRCRACGCFTKAKAAMPHERCPIDRW